MARCSHEGICNCDIQSGHGITVTGRGQPNNPFTLTADGQALVGQGLAWDPQRKRFAAKIAEGGGLAFDMSGGLILSEKGGEGGTIPGASVADLLKRAASQNIVGGWHGAGYMIKPQGTQATYTYGVQRGVDLMHVPTRFLTDGTPVVTPSEELTRQNGNGISDYNDRRTLVAQQTVHRWRRIPQNVGITGPGYFPDQQDDDPAQGWFGYLEENETGLPSLADVFDLVGRSSVLVIDLRFPPIKGDPPIWDAYAPSPTQITQFLDRTRVLIQRYGLQQSVIVTTPTPKIPGTDGPINVLARFVDSAIPAGPRFATQADADKYPPGETWPNGWQVAFFDAQIKPETVKTYSDAQIHGFYYPISRHHHHTDLVTPSGAAGVLSPDPEYYAGQFADHPTAGSWAYRMTSDRFWFSTITPGLLPPTEDRDTVQPNYRGYMPRARQPDSFVQLGEHCVLAGEVYCVLQGWCSPIETPDNYQLNMLVDVYGPTGGPGMGAHLVFGVDSDAPFRGVPTEKTGYSIAYRVANNGDPKKAMLKVWDPDAAEGKGAEVNLGAPQDCTWLPNGHFMPLRLRVNPNRIELCGYGDASFTDPPKWTLDTSTLSAHEQALGTAHRGGYLFFGREDPGTNPDPKVACRFNGLRITPKAGG